MWEKVLKGTVKMMKLCMDASMYSKMKDASMGIGSDKVSNAATNFVTLRH